MSQVRSRFAVAEVAKRDRHTFVRLRAFYAKEIPDVEQFSQEGPEATLSFRLDTEKRTKLFTEGALFDVTVTPVID